MSERSKREKELRRELRRVKHRETQLLTKSRYRKSISLESVLNKYLPDKLEQTLDSAFREAFRLIFDKGTAVIGKTFNEKKLRASEGDTMEVQKRWAADMLMTSVEGTEPYETARAAVKDAIRHRARSSAVIFFIGDASLKCRFIIQNE